MTAASARAMSSAGAALHPLSTETVEDQPIPAIAFTRGITLQCLLKEDAGSLVVVGCLRRIDHRPAPRREVVGVRKSRPSRNVRSLSILVSR